MERPKAEAEMAAMPGEMAGKSRDTGPIKRPNDGPPDSFKVALVCGDSEAKGQTATEGFCRASARQR
jgi:hypothetical protein